jgi:hypothetical protein
VNRVEECQNFRKEMKVGRSSSKEELDVGGIYGNVISDKTSVGNSNAHPVKWFI